MSGPAGVDLSTYAGVGSTVTPGNAAGSLLHMAVTGNGVRLMPPVGPLAAAQVQQIADWINQGAPGN